MNRKAIISLLAPLVSACSGDIGPGEEVPGDSTYLESGSLAVDANTEKIFVLQTVYEETPTPSPTPTADTTPTGETPPPPAILSRDLFAIDPDSGALQSLGDVMQIDDMSIHFPKGSVLVMGLQDAKTQVRKYDAMSLELQYDTAVDIPYMGLTVAPGGAFLSAFAWSQTDDEGNLTAPSSVHMLEIDTARTHHFDAGGLLPATAWLRSSDRLLTVLADLGDDDRLPSLRLLGWSAADLEANDFALDDDGTWKGAGLDLQLADSSPDLSLLFGRVDVSPDDRVAVLPVLRWEEVPAEEGSTETDGEEEAPTYKTMDELKIVDLATGKVETVADANGPVGFTPDGSTIVSYGYRSETDDAGESYTQPYLLMIDIATLALEMVDIPAEGNVEYYVTREGNFVVIEADDYVVDENGVTSEAETLLLLDLDNGQMTQVSDAPFELDDFVSRMGHNELWAVDQGALYRIDYDEALLEPVSLDWKPTRIQYLPQRDRLVLNDADASTVRLFDPASRQVSLSVALPTPTPAP